MCYSKPLQFDNDSINEASSYAGDQSKMLLKTHVSLPKGLSINALCEKDKGEQIAVNNTKKGFDFYSANMYYEGTKMVKKVVIGDFTAHFGQGLVLWTGYSFSGGPLSVKKKGNGIRPKTGTDENMFLRGIGVTTGGKRCVADLFYSYHKIDASLSDSLTVSSIQTSGYHRTESELRNKHALGMHSVGGHVSFRGSRLKVGVSHVSHSFDKLIQPRVEPYTVNQFCGRYMNMTGVDYFLNRQSFDMFGECAVDEHLDIATIHGISFGVVDGINAVASVRHLSPGYNTFLNTSFSSTGKPSNEQGVTLAFEYRPDTSVVVVPSIDAFRHMRPTYSTISPWSGTTYSITVNKVLSATSTFSCLYSYSKSEKNDPLSERPIKNVIVVQSHVVKMMLANQMNDKLKFKNQVQLQNINSSPEKLPFLISQDVEYKTKRWQLLARYVFYDAGSEIRFSMYEKGLGTGTFAQLTQDGYKWLVLTTLNVAKHMKLSAKISCLNRSNSKVYDCVVSANVVF